jgi:glycosyltransferase involved in cell wall biosynthesis
MSVLCNKFRMKKLTIVYHYFAHYREPVLMAVISRIVNRGGAVDLLADTGSNLPNLKLVDVSKLCSEGATFKCLKNVWFGKWLWQVGLVVAFIKSPASTWVFLGQFSFLSTWCCLLMAKLLGKKTYLWTHGLYGNESRIKLTLRLMFYRLANGLLLYGDYSKEILMKHGYSESRLHVIYNSLDYDEQVRLRAQMNEQIVGQVRAELFGDAKKDVPYVIYVGRLTEVKELDILMVAIEKLNLRCGSRVNCLFVGDGPEREKLELLAQKEEISEYIKFYGAEHDEEKLCRLFYAADVCASPGNVGLTAMHALTYGVPVVTHDDRSWQMPEFEAITPGVSGDFFKRGDIDSLVQAIDKWTTDKASREATRNECFRVIDEKYNPSHQAGIIESLALG